MILGNEHDHLATMLEDFELGNTSVNQIKNHIADIDDEKLRAMLANGVKTLAPVSDKSKQVIDENFVTATKILREKGFKTALLTNNGWADDEKTTSICLQNVDIFDIVVESCKVKMRKPFPEIYLLTAEKLGLKPEQCVFIDDLEANIEGAKKVGMKGIRVVLGDSETAIKELQDLLKIDLKA